MVKSIKNNPFSFLISLMLVLACGLVGLLNSGPVGTIPIAETETPSIILPSIPGVVLLNNGADTTTPSPIPQVITATSAPATPSPTREETGTRTANPLMIYILDVGQGDSILVVSPEGMTALIDGGSGGSGALATLRGIGVARIDLMIATHPHEDHIGGLTQVLEGMPVGRVITNGQPHTTAAYEHFLDAILGSGAEYSEVQRGASLALGAVVFSVLNPGATLGEDLNENSVVITLEYRQTRILFMGDAGMDAEASMMAAGVDLRAEILKVGHHGSCTASNKAFLHEVGPEVGIYTAGIDNTYHLPCLATIYALDEQGILVLGTDVYGRIIVRVTADGYQISDSTGVDLRR
jgi:competence protein ComEC